MNDYKDPSTLRKLYHGQGLSSYKIGDKLGVSASTVRYQMKKHGIERRESGSSKDYVPLCQNPTSGRKEWQHKYDGERATVYVHQLLSIAEGADPHKVFGRNGNVIKHKNGVPWDNRAENIELITRSELMGGYSREEMLEWIDAFVHEFGIPPSNSDLTGWPGPSSAIYHREFGGVAHAVKEAGYEPRGKIND